MANDKQLTAADIKGDLAQRLNCPVCTVSFAQAAGRNRVEFDKLESKDSDRKAISFICNDCKDKDVMPTIAFRLIIASDGTQIVNQVNAEDLPDPSEARGKEKTAAQPGKTTRSRRSGRSRGKNSSSNVPEEEEDEAQLHAAGSQVTTLEE